MTKRDGDPIVVVDKNNPTRRYLVAKDENIAKDVHEVTGEKIHNAKIRFSHREPTKAERITMALAIRELNQKGIFWTDHKLKNFDIVADSASPTGHRMVLFDTGGFKPMVGANDKLRWRNARIFQRLFDGTPTDQAVNRAFGQLNFENAVDLRAFGGRDTFLLTPDANINRAEYLRLNNMTPAEFKTEVSALSQQLGREIPYAPPGG